MSERRQADICIIGGGPAGSAFAIRSARLGHRVILVESGRPRHRHFGESLSPGVRVQLELLGVAGLIDDAGFPPFRWALLYWEDADPTARDSSGLLVERARFDRILREAARAAGVCVLEPAAICERRLEGDTWRVEIDTPEGRVRLDTAFLAIARGRAAASSRTRQATGPATLGLSAQWQGTGSPAEPCIEAGADHWYWGMPLPDGRYSTMVLVDPRRFRRDREPLAEALTRLLARSRLLAGCLSGRLIGPVLAGDATPFIDAAPVGRREIRLGEAALALDPLSSSGVQRALQGALAAATVVNTMLRRPSDAPAARAFYRDSLTAAADRHRRWTEAFYRSAGRASPFWRERAAASEPETHGVIAPPPDPSSPIALAPDAALLPTACIVGDFVSRRAALHHPRLTEPVAFVAGEELAPLLRRLRPGMTAADIVKSWSDRVAPRSGIVIVRWMLERGIAVPLPAAAG